MSKEIQISYIQKSLEILSCPFIEDGNEQWLAELLLHPSEARLKLLHWVACSYDSAFKDILNNSAPVISNRIDSRHQKLLLVFNIMTVCKIDDLELIRGTASQKKQLNFWTKLLDMLYISEFGYPFVKDTLHEETYVLKASGKPTVEDGYISSCKFMDALVREHSKSDLFSTETHLFSPDLEAECKDQVVPSVEMLIETAEKIKVDLDGTSRDLEMIKNNFEFVEIDQGIVDNYCRKIDLSMKTLSQMIDTFSHCYDNDIETWCNKERPVLSNIGPTVKTVNRLMLNQQHLNESLKLLSASTHSLKNDFKQELYSVEENVNKPELLAELREASSILKMSLQRTSISK